MTGPAVAIPGGWSLKASGNAGYLLSTDLVFDLSDPLHPVPVGDPDST